MEQAEKYVQQKKSNPSLAKLYNSTYEYLFGNLELKQTDVVIDFGSGTGDIIANYLAPFVHKVYGLDISPQMIRLAKYTNQKCKNAEFVLGDFTTLEKFLGHRTKHFFRVDKFVSIFVMNFFEDYASFLQRAHNLLKPGGQIVLSIPLILEQGMVAEVFNTSKWSIYSKQDQPKQATWVYSYGKNELPNFSQSLADTGYRVTHYSAKSVEIRLDSIEKICEMITVWDPLLTSVPRERRVEFLRDLEIQVLANLDRLSIRFDDVGSALFVFNVVWIIAEKL